MTTSTFDRATVRELHTAIQQALAGVASTYGVTIEVQNGSFSESTYTTRVTARSEKGAAVVAQSNEFAWKLLGFEGDLTGREFYANGKIFVIDSIMPSRPKYPIVAHRKGCVAMRYKFSADTVRASIIVVDGNGESIPTNRQVTAQSIARMGAHGNNVEY